MFFSTIVNIVYTCTADGLFCRTSVLLRRVKSSICFTLSMASHSQNPKRFNKKNKLVIAVLALVAVLLVSLWVTQEISFWPGGAVKPNIASMQPIAGYYLTFRGNITRIFVVSAILTSGSYPYTRSAIGSKPGSPPVVKKGEPCVIINVTVRNDYSSQFPTPNPYPGSPTSAYVFLAAKIFNENKEIQATDLTQVGLPP